MPPKRRTAKKNVHPCIFIKQEILNNNFNNQAQCRLLSLPPEILDNILSQAAYHTKDKLMISMSCKWLALSLPRPITAAELPRNVELRAASAQVTRRSNFMLNLESWFNDSNREAIVGHQMLLGEHVSYAKKMMKRDWRLCSVCSVFKTTVRVTKISVPTEKVMEIGDNSDEWRSVKKKTEKGKRVSNGDPRTDELWLCPIHEVSAGDLINLRDP